MEWLIKSCVLCACLALSIAGGKSVMVIKLSCDALSYEIELNLFADGKSYGISTD